MNVWILCLALFLRFVLEVKQTRTTNAITKDDQRTVNLIQPTDGGHSHKESKRYVYTSKVKLCLFYPCFGNRLGGSAFLTHVEEEDFESVLTTSEDFFKVGLLLFHAVIEEKCLVPFREGSLKAACTLESLFVTELKETTHSVEVSMVVIADFLILSALILESIEKGITMHVDIRLLSEEALTISIETIEHSGVITILPHHLLMLELIFLILEFLDPLERRLANWHIPGRSHMQVHLHLIHFGLGLDAHLSRWAQFALLSEEVAEEDGDGRLHLLEDIFVDDLLGDLVARVTSRAIT